MNTGDSLVALRYSVHSRVGQNQSRDATPPAEVGKLHHSSHVWQEFAQSSDATNSTPGTSDYKHAYLQELMSAAKQRSVKLLYLLGFHHSQDSSRTKCLIGLGYNSHLLC